VANLEKYPIKDGCSVFAGTVLGVRVALYSLNAWNRLASTDCPVILCSKQGGAEFPKNPGLFCSQFRNSFLEVEHNSIVLSGLMCSLCFVVEIPVFFGNFDPR